MRPAPRVASSVLAGAGPALLLLTALVPDLRFIGAVVLGAGWIGLRATRRPEAIAWAAALPVGVGMTTPWLLGADEPLGAAQCVDPFSIIAVRRVIAAATVLAIVAALAIAHRSSARELGLAMPPSRQVAIAAGGLIVLVAGGLVVGPVIARPFFGPLDFPVPPAALVPALAFGLANGLLEEVAYRGAMQAWLARAAQPWIAVAFQGLVFGAVHAGPEVVALLPLHIGLLAAVGIGGGIVRLRTGSLVIPAGIHIGADIALYVGLACRATG